MIRFRNFNTAYWGYIRTAAEAYECDKKVNALIGQSGSGKTTLMDALRIVLGDARFENNRTMDHYINPNSNWAVAMASFANGVEEDYPFKPSGYNESSVTVCVRLDKSSAKPSHLCYFGLIHFYILLHIWVMGNNHYLSHIISIEYRFFYYLTLSF